MAVLRLATASFSSPVTSTVNLYLHDHFCGVNRTEGLTGPVILQCCCWSSSLQAFEFTEEETSLPPISFLWLTVESYLDPNGLLRASLIENVFMMQRKADRSLKNKQQQKKSGAETLQKSRQVSAGQPQSTKTRWHLVCVCVCGAGGFMLWLIA